MQISQAMWRGAAHPAQDVLYGENSRTLTISEVERGKETALEACTRIGIGNKLSACPIFMPPQTFFDIFSSIASTRSLFVLV